VKVLAPENKMLPKLAIIKDLKG